MSQKYLMLAAVALVLGACASAPRPNAALETARAQVAAAETDPNVAQ
jgi:PBP1b-binding outer membrane lipoprotein LpoB